MEKTYNPQAIEKATYQTWEQHHAFRPAGQGPAYSIVLPPPNVTGTLHMGHGFQHTLMDTLIRYHRMQGYNTLWQPGVDHAGIATQMVVERQLTQENTSRHDLGREAFTQRVHRWKEQSGNQICQQVRRLGASTDWSRERFTMDSEFNTVVRNVFIQLHQEGLIYRGERLVNWDPAFRTAVSDLEVVTEEEPGKLWYFHYPLSDSDEKLQIATTRPETMLGDTAVAVHPEDSRYQQLIGKHIKLPLSNREIPIIADEYVDSEFGSGCVKITPAHDFNDYEIGKRHQLPLINILTEEATINHNAPESYQGLDRFQAREQIVNDMKDLGLLEKIEDYTIKIPRGDRSGAVIEPFLTKQWYVKVAPLVKPAIEAVEQGDIKFIPNNWSKTYFQWMHNLEDWCISRQLWWGHRVPAWYDESGHVYVGSDEETIRAQYNLDQNVQLRQDEDVLDTWFSSALWPFVTLGWPEDTDTFETFYPTSVLVTGFDIIFFWVARMIMFGLKFTGKVPFKEVYITGLIRDSEGQKMSKSKGNVLDPIDLIDGISLDELIAKRCANLMQPQKTKKVKTMTQKAFPEGIAAHGTDALRFTFCALANNNRNINFDINRMTGYRNFCNKLWNAARFVLMNTQEADWSQQAIEYSLPDQWIQSRLHQTINKVHHYFAQYRFDYLSQAIYEFIWHEYCDWYLELSKVYLTQDESPALKRGTQLTLVTVLEAILRLAHPVIPFITEAIWQEIKPLLNITSSTIMLQPFPQTKDFEITRKAEQAINWLQQVTLAIRNIRGEMNIAPNKALPVLLTKGSTDDQAFLKQVQPALQAIARLESVQWTNEQTLPACATGVVNSLEIHIPLANLVDIKEETARLKKEFNKLESDIARLQKKLDNPHFVEKAPTQVVTKEQEKLAQAQATYDKLKQQEQKLANLD